VIQATSTIKNGTGVPKGLRCLILYSEGVNMSDCLKWRVGFVGVPTDPSPSALDRLDQALVHHATWGRVVEHGRLRATRLVVKSALEGPYQRTLRFISLLTERNRRALRAALEDTGCYLWDPARNKPVPL
jgi:hypothetical protein